MEWCESVEAPARRGGSAGRPDSDPQTRQVAIVLNGKVVTMHKVREAIRGGDVQITSSAPGAAAYLLDQLRAHTGAGTARTGP